MRNALLVVAACAVAIGVSSVARGQNVLPDARTFKPARIAVVDITEVFENYQKKKDIEAVLEKEIKEEEGKFGEQQKVYKQLQEELKNVQEGTDQHKDLTLKIRAMEYELKTKEKDIVAKFQKEQLKELKEIRDEITADIQSYAEGLGIDIVLEKQVAAEGKGNSIRWPIVHYVKPELEITKDIIQRLNAQYGKPSTGVEKAADATTGKKK